MPTEAHGRPRLRRPPSPPGGTWLPSLDTKGWNEVGRFTTELVHRPQRARRHRPVPRHQGQRLRLSERDREDSGDTVADRTVTGGGQTFSNVTIQAGSVGYLSDYFDQAAQASLADDVAGSGALPAPRRPAAGHRPATPPISAGDLTTLQDTTSTTTYNAPTSTNLVLSSGNLTLSRGTNTTGRTFNFNGLYVAGNLTLTGPVTVNATSLYVGGTITIKNTTSGAPAVTDTVGPLYVAGDRRKQRDWHGQPRHDLRLHGRLARDHQLDLDAASRHLRDRPLLRRRPERVRGQHAVRGFRRRGHDQRGLHDQRRHQHLQGLDRCRPMWLRSAAVRNPRSIMATSPGVAPRR